MTTTTTKRFSFDRDEVAKFESSEGDERQQIWLSPYAIPSDLSIGRTADGLLIDIRYFGDEPASDPRPLGDATVPAVFLRHGRVTKKVMTVWVPLATDSAPAAGTPADAAPLVRSLADRLVTAADHRDHPGERLSLRLTGKLLRDIALQMSAARPSPDLSAAGWNPNIRSAN